MEESKIKILGKKVDKFLKDSILRVSGVNLENVMKSLNQQLFVIPDSKTPHFITFMRVSAMGQLKRGI